jgi:hypothetical protein
MTWLYADEVIALYSQDEHWIDRHGVKHLLSEMDDGYLSNLYDFVRRNIGVTRAAILNLYPLGNFPMGPMALFEVEQSWQREHDQIEGWIKNPDSCPLLAAIDRELADRAELVPERTL